MESAHDKSSCGVGFVVSLENSSSHQSLSAGLQALVNLEHRGGVGADLRTSDGAGIMTDIPFELFGIPESSGVASLLLPNSTTLRVRSLKVFEETFLQMGLEIFQYREVPVDLEVLTEQSRANVPGFFMAFIKRPEQCTTRYSFEKLLYSAKQATRSKLRQAGIKGQFFFTSLSAGTVVYKALTTSQVLPEFFLDLKNPAYKTRFALVHRRFSTNTSSSWDKAQPFRVVAHNGEINTIAGNRAWAFARERALGIQEDELLTHKGISDSGSVNEMVEALMFRSSIPHVEDIMAIMMPQAETSRPFYKFWSRAMEPWDGPALFTFSDGRTIGARLDRSGFRPCRWVRTEKHFYLSSEAGSFEIPENLIVAKGALSGGSSVSVDIKSGSIHFCDPSDSYENKMANFDPGLKALPRLSSNSLSDETLLERLKLFKFTEEDIKKMLLPTVKEGKEPIGSMGDTARLAALSTESRSIFDYFYQNFAQVTNPPLDYLREKMVTDMTVVLGRKPNIFEPKELIPAKRGIELDGPVLSLGQIELLKSLANTKIENPWGVNSEVFDTTFLGSEGLEGFEGRLLQLKEQALEAILQKKSLFILSDRAQSRERPGIPVIFVLSFLIQTLNENGMRLRASIVVETGEARNTHHLAVLLGFGAAAVCPYMALELSQSRIVELVGEELAAKSSSDREKRFIFALEQGILKIISKMGVSVLQSYQGSGLFTILGFGEELHKRFFPKQVSLIGGLDLSGIVKKVIDFEKEDIVIDDKAEISAHKFPSQYLYREHPKEMLGERHSMTLPRSKIIHQLLDGKDINLQSMALYEAYLKSGLESEPITIRHLLAPKKVAEVLPLDQVQGLSEIFKTFGSGAMSFGAISAEAQRDIILAMRDIGARSNSGEGGENPFYFTEGVHAHTKQIGSGRFGVTAEYLVNGDEIQIKMAQGAKPGEGGQLMACKVGSETARARFSDENVDLISPPPMHDIYSIEDLKQLIYEIRQLKSTSKVSVKLVSGENIGTIAVGVAKAGADIIHIAGHDGGTGAATLTSMKHAGLPWEIGLAESHKALVKENLRHRVTLRVDGGLSSGRDILVAAILGAEEFDFGKLLLVAEGCIMARICEKNTCPTGIATHDPRFKKRYKGSKEKIIQLLTYIGEDLRRNLSAIGARNLTEVLGRGDLLELNPRHLDQIISQNLDLSAFLSVSPEIRLKGENIFKDELSPLNQKIVADVLAQDAKKDLFYALTPKERAVLATLNGVVAGERAIQRFGSSAGKYDVAVNATRFRFSGSAGQGFGVFSQSGFEIRLEGEANDSVAKSMSGGKIVIVPFEESNYVAAENTIIGNCALYGATGGTLYVYGIAGDRFAIRNSGATAVVEGTGVQACEYMTRGRVLILGSAGANIGAGMTGGLLFIRKSEQEKINESYISAEASSSEDHLELRKLLEDYFFETNSKTAKSFLENWSVMSRDLLRCVPKRAFLEVTKVATSEPSNNILV